MAGLARTLTPHLSRMADDPWRPGRRGLSSIAGEPGSLVGATFAMLESALQELTMTTPTAPADASPIPSATVGPAALPAPPSWPWRRTALLLTGAGIGRTGLLFIPALAVLAVAGAKLWREQP